MNRQILIVDDEPNVRLNYRLALESEGFTIHQAGNGAKALEILSFHPIDLAILDFRMPEMDGLQLLSRMRKCHFSTPVVIITAYGDASHAAQAMKLGAIDFLQEPTTPTTLREVVGDVLDRHQGPSDFPSEDKDDFETHMRQSRRLLNLQNFAEARRHLIRALELNCNADAFNLAGVLFEMQNEQERARRYYAQAAKLEPGDAAARQNLRRLALLTEFDSAAEPISLGDK